MQTPRDAVSAVCTLQRKRRAMNLLNSDLNFLRLFTTSCFSVAFQNKKVFQLLQLKLAHFLTLLDNPNSKLYLYKRHFLL